MDTGARRTDADAIRANVVTSFNVVLAGLILALIVVGEVRDSVFVGSVVAANVAIATAQELVAIRRLRRLQALTAPVAMVVRDGEEREIPADEVVEGDVLHLRSGDQVVCDGPILSGSVELDEALLTGESTTIRREHGEEMLSGSFCVSGDCFYRADRVGMQAYAVSLTAQARELSRSKSPLMIRFDRLLRVLLIVTGALATVLLIQFVVQDRGLPFALKAATATVTTVVPAGLLLGITVVLVVGALRVSRSGAIVQATEAVEALNYVDVIALDKTGTLTTNRLRLGDVVWAPAMEGLVGWLGAFASATATENKTASALADGVGGRSNGATAGGRVAFSSARRWSAVELSLGAERRAFALGAPETVMANADTPPNFAAAFADATERGLRVVAFAATRDLPPTDGELGEVQPVALLLFEDELRLEVRAAFATMRELEIEPKVISGDNPATVAALLRQLGIEPRGVPISGEEIERLEGEAFADAVEANTVFGRVRPELKSRLIEALQARGHYVAMVGDGANDVHALRASDVPVAMASGTPVTRAVAGIVLLDDSFAALIQGAHQATAVIGNVARLSKLFVAKSVYAFLLIFATNLLGLDFPFLPRQGSVVSVLTLGIPAIFISVTAPLRGAARNFTRSVLAFALPAGFALAIAGMLLQFATEGVLRRDIEEARTLVSLTLTLAGLAFVVQVVGFDEAEWRRPARPILTMILTAMLVVLLVWTVKVSWLRSFFAFTPVSRIGWAAVAAAVLATLAGQYALSHYWQRIIDFLIAKPGPSDRLRGKQI